RAPEDIEVAELEVVSDQTAVDVGVPGATVAGTDGATTGLRAEQHGDARRLQVDQSAVGQLDSSTGIELEGTADDDRGRGGDRGGAAVRNLDRRRRTDLHARDDDVRATSDTLAATLEAYVVETHSTIRYSRGDEHHGWDARQPLLEGHQSGWRIEAWVRS